jgi:uncharacterized protein YidB (DUF937 family)
MSMLSQLASSILSRPPQGAGQAAGPGPAEHTAILSTILGMLNHPQIGGISGLLQKFQSAGLGHLVQGWISNGPNPPVTPDQLHQAIGPDQVNAIAQKLGIPPGEATKRIAAYLPEVIDKLTPNGQIPAQTPVS